MRKLSLLALIFAFNGSAQTDYAVVKLPDSKLKSYSASQVEPSIAINPENPDEIAAGSVLVDYYYSKDGGKSWKVRKMKSPFGVFGDPVLVFDTSGRLYYFHLASFKESSHLDRIVCQYTDNVSGRFNIGTYPKPNGSKVQDKHWVVVNPITNELYMTWTQFDAYNSAKETDSSFILFSKSSNRGETWSDPIRISKFGGDCLDDDNTVEGAVPAVGPNGEIYVTWTGPNGLVFQKSLDGGKTWMEEENQLEKHIGGWTLDIPGIYRANGLPILKCDLSNGPNRGTLYMNWCDQRNGVENTDVWIKKSMDGGESWSEPIRVNQDTSDNHQFFTWLTIDPSTGYLYCVYYDRRNYEGNQTDVYVSVSKDGGEKFEDIRVSDKPFNPDPKMFFGDYLNIDALNGLVVPIWPRMDEGKISLYVTLMNFR